MQRWTATIAIAICLAIPSRFSGYDFFENTAVYAQISYTHSYYACANTNEPNSVLAEFYGRYANETARAAFSTGNADYNYYTWAYSVEALKYAQASYFVTFDLNGYYAGLWHYWAAAFGQVSYLYD